MSDCTVCDKEKNTQLSSGSVVCKWCSKFMRECEAESLLRFDLYIRRYRLAEIEKYRGKRAADELREVMTVLWAKKRPAD